MRCTHHHPCDMQKKGGACNVLRGLCMDVEKEEVVGGRYCTLDYMYNQASDNVERGNYAIIILFYPTYYMM